LYGYVENDPINWIDPLGLQSFFDPLTYSPELGRDYAEAFSQFIPDIIRNAVVPGPYGSPDPDNWGSWGSPSSWSSLPCEAGKSGKFWETAEWVAIGAATAATTAAVVSMGAEAALEYEDHDPWAASWVWTFG